MQTTQFDHFYSYQEMTDFLLECEREFPAKFRLISLADTAQGRKIWLAEITDFSTMSESQSRSAYYVQAGLHAEEGAGTTAALHWIETLLTQTAANQLLDHLVFYIVPRVNPDGSEYAITQCASVRSYFEQKEDIANALIPQDINHDGMVLQMRKLNPLGTFADIDDSGIMVPRLANMTGSFYDVYPEGYFENYDGGSWQPAMCNIDMNRSFPASWRPMKNSEAYPCRGIETRAIAEFMTTHQNIFACIDFHCGSGGILRPLMSSDDYLNQEDRHLIEDVGRLAECITGLPLIHEREYQEPGDRPEEAYGCTGEWCYHALGISSYVIELGNGFTGIGLPTDVILKNWRFVENYDWLHQIVNHHRRSGKEILVPWKKFTHPQLGEIEIGGMKNGLAYYMCPPDMVSVIPKTTQFLLEHAAMGPRLVLAKPQVTSFGSGVYRIRTQCMNIGRFGTTVMSGAEGPMAQSDVSIRLSSKEKPVTILSRPARFTISKLDSMERVSAEWFIQGTENQCIQITASHCKCTTVTAEFHL